MPPCMFASAAVDMKESTYKDLYDSEYHLSRHCDNLLWTSKHKNRKKKKNYLELTPDTVPEDFCPPDDEFDEDMLDWVREERPARKREREREDG